MGFLQGFNIPIIDKEKERKTPPPMTDVPKEYAAPAPLPDVPEEASPAPAPQPDIPVSSVAESTEAQAPEIQPEEPKAKPDSRENERTRLLEAFDSMDTALKDVSRQFYEIVEQQNKIITSMADIQTTLPKLEDELPKLQEAINGVRYDKAVEELCRMHQEIVLRNRVKQDQDLSAVVEALSRILREDFGLEVIHPKRGDTFDAELDRRVQADMPLGRIGNCLAVGWMLRDQAILRAIVETYFDLEGGVL